jgi:hypothetical protein
MSAKGCWQQLIFRVMAFRRALCGFALQIPGCWVLGESAAARLREFFLGEIAFKTPATGKASDRTILERNGGSAIRPTSLSTSDVKKNFTAYVMTMSWMQLLL